jgi:hypothetical protein
VPILLFNYSKSFNRDYMKKILSGLLLVTALALAGLACKKSFLDVAPVGVLDEAALSTEKGVNKLLIAAYAMLDAHDGDINIGGEWGSGGSNFLYGSIGGGEANKGSSSGDQAPNMTPIQRHEASPVNGALNDRWKAIYEGVKRCNTTMRILGKVQNISDASKKNIAGQARFLRAWYHFQARIIYEKVPYLDEIIDDQLTTSAIDGVSNDAEAWPKILEDAKYAWDNLPVEQDAVGRVNKWVAGALYGKILMFAKNYATARTILQDVVTNGVRKVGSAAPVPFALLANYDDNFNVDFDNNAEQVFSFQSSSLDNAGARNGNWGDLLNTPAATGGGGAGFFTPTYFFVNQFKTNAAGLPAASPQNTVVMDPFAQAGYTRYSGNVDVRLDWTVGRDGVPFHDWGTYLTTWPRERSAGPYAGKKTMIRQSQVSGTHDASVWFIAGGTALNLNLIRFSDVILLLAEAEIEAPGGSLVNAFTLVNRVRARAQNSRKVSFDPAYGTPVTAPYTAPFATQAEARTAVRIERLLELGMEGHRFFDLVRWGIATNEIQAYFTYESQFPYQVLLKTPVPAYTAPADDYYPIPQSQIDLSNGFLKQR